MEKYELIDSCRTLEDSFFNDLKFYKTHRENVFITDYDIRNIHNLPKQDLKLKDLLMVFLKEKGKFNSYFMSTMLLEDKEEVIKIIDSL